MRFDLPRRLLVGLVKSYRLLLSPWLGSSCRFYPTCSLYAIEALERHGALSGGYFAVRRLVRCGPWCEGGCDAVPEQPPRLFSRLISARDGARPIPLSSEKQNLS